jgi:hypothetical protein
MISMSNWSNLEWHYDIHTRFGEQLVFYLVSIRPFDPQKVQGGFSGFLESEKLESVRVFKIVGPNDLLVRAWIHANNTFKFPDLLKDSLKYAGTRVLPFVVTTAFAISSTIPSLELPSDSDLLSTLDDEETIKALQTGRSNHLLTKLIEEGLVITKDSEGVDPAKFYLAITLGDNEEEFLVDAAKRLYIHLTNNMPTIKRFSIYIGTGFCNILVKGEVEDNLFGIGELIDWIYVELWKYKAVTETYLIPWSAPIVETPDTISEATLDSIKGKDLFTNGMIPEVYRSYPQKRLSIENFFRSSNRAIVSENKKLVREFLMGYMEDSVTGIGRVLYTLFSEIEDFLEQNHKMFAGKHLLEPNVVYDSISVSKDNRKYVALGHLFNFYSHIINNKSANSEENILSDWNSLIVLRNKPLHGKLPLNEWDQALRTLIEYLPVVKNLIKIVFQCNKKSYKFTYFPELARDVT